MRGGVLVAVVIAGVGGAALGQGQGDGLGQGLGQEDAGPELMLAVAAQEDAVDRTEKMLEEKISERKAQLATRVRALYKLARGGEVALWLDAGERRDRVAWESAARRVLSRDIDELRQFQAELDAAHAARVALQQARQQAARVRRPERRSLRRPVPGSIVERFGIATDAASGAKLSRRGIALRTRVGREVLAVAGGVVAWVGPVRGLHHAVIVDHDGFTSVLAGLDAPTVTAGRRIDAGQPIGAAAGLRIHLEVRLPVGPGGLPIDPEPLLR